MAKRDWKSHVDRLLQEAEDEGQFNNLRGQGQPLKFEDESHIPADMRMANRLLKEHDLVPDWILLRQEIEGRQAKLVARIERGWKGYQAGLVAANLSSTPFVEQQNAEAAWRDRKTRYQQAVDKLNRDIMRYNLKVPPGFPQQALFKLEKALAQISEQK